MTRLEKEPRSRRTGKEMMMATRSSEPIARSDFELRFSSLLKTGSGFVFPCDVDGEVPIDEFTEVLRNNYFYARALVGAELAWPVVIAKSSTLFGQHGD